MDEQFLYLRIADSLRRDIASGLYKLGDPLPSIRTLAGLWQCTNGTIQRSIRELASEGLVSAHIGTRTRVKDVGLSGPGESLQRANLIHQAEKFILESVTNGFSTAEIEDAFRVALQRWRAVDLVQLTTPRSSLSFCGSHDLAVAWLATHFNEVAPGHMLQVKFSGSLPGVTAFQRGEADIAGTHLLDESTGTYNLAALRELMPDEKIALVTLAQRRIGFMVKPGNPKNISGVQDLAGTGVRFINRQKGSGTRVLLDSLLRENGIDKTKITGYEEELTTHSDVATAISEGRADTGIGLEAAARAYGLEFILITLERYDLLVREKHLSLQPYQQLLNFLKSGEFHQQLQRLGGYDSRESGVIRWSR